MTENLQPEPTENGAARTPRPAEPAELRIGGADRDDAIGLLQDHLTAGRLNNEEFDERIGKALTARTNSELAVLFTDLPGRRPGEPGATSGGVSDFGYAEQDLGQGKQLAPQSGASPYGAPASPYQAMPPTSQNHGMNMGWMAPGLLVPIAVVLCFIIGWNFWWLIPIAAVASSQISYQTGRRRRQYRHRGDTMR